MGKLNLCVYRKRRQLNLKMQTAPTAFLHRFHDKRIDFCRFYTKGACDLVHHLQLRRTKPIPARSGRELRVPFAVPKWKKKYCQKTKVLFCCTFRGQRSVNPALFWLVRNCVCRVREGGGGTVLLFWAPIHGFAQLIKPIFCWS